MANAANLVNFGAGGGTAIGDVIYSAYALTAPSYLPLNSDTASYLTSSYPTLGAIYAPTTVAYSTTTTTIPVNGSAYNFNFGNNTYLGWDTTGNIITSADCVNWNVSGINTDYIVRTNAGVNIKALGGWLSMAYGNGRFVALRPAPIFTTSAGASETTSIGGTAVSTDNGLTWTQGTIPQTFSVAGTDITYLDSNYNWRCIGFGNGYFQAYGFAVASGGGTGVAVSSYSADGIEWSSPTGLGTATTIYYTVPAAMAYGNGVFVLPYSAQASTSTVVFTRSGTTPGSTVGWTVQNLATAQWWRSIAFGNGVFVVVGSAAAAGSNIANTSTDGVTWTNRTLPATLLWVSVTFANGYFVAVGNDPASASITNAIATSTDGITWTLRATTAAITHGPVAGGNGRFIYQDATTASIIASSRASVINFSVSSSSFTLPMVAPMKAMTPYMKAT